MELSERYRLRTVDIVIYAGFKALEAVEIVHVLEYANKKLAQDGFPPAYDVRLVAAARGHVQSDTLVGLHVDQALSPHFPPDVAFIVGAKDIAGAVSANPEVVQWCRDAHARIGRLVGLCSGAFFLAEAGLLDGRRATTHWSVTGLLQQRHPRVTVDADAIFVRDGRFWTSAGVTTGLDVALAMVEEDLGRSVALALARDLVVYVKRPGTQAQLSIHLNTQMTPGPDIRRLQEWILDHLDTPLCIADLAARVAMSERNFARVFSRETGHAPAKFIEIARVEAARRLLEDDVLPIKSVASRCGFTSDDHMRRAFLRRCETTPAEYRQRALARAIPPAKRSRGAVEGAR